MEPQSGKERTKGHPDSGVFQFRQAFRRILRMLVISSPASFGKQLSCKGNMDDGGHSE